MTEPSAPPGIAILMYHSIGRSTTERYRALTVDPGLFDEHIAALIDARANLIAVRDVPGVLSGSATERLRQRRAAAEDRTSMEPGARERAAVLEVAEGAAGQEVAGGVAVAISIDDGLADAATGAAPVLAPHCAPATLFVPTAYVGRTAAWMSGEDADRPLLSWGGLEELADIGMEIASHGHLHLAADINEPQHVREDALRSRAELEAHLGRAVSSYAYPYGYWTRDAANAISDAGFSQACALMELPAVAADDPLILPRIYVGPQTTPEMLLRLVHRRPTPAMRRWALVKQQVWHAGHRWAGWGPQEARSISDAQVAIDLGA